MRAIDLLDPWRSDDHALLLRLVGDAPMMRHLGGPETPRQVAARHARYLRTSDQFAIVDPADGQRVGWIGSWPKTWQGRDVTEVGWAIVPERQGRGLASRALKALLETLPGQEVHAFPAVENAPSNALCEKAGFTLDGPHDFEYPPGHTMRCNDWFSHSSHAP